MNRIIKKVVLLLLQVFVFYNAHAQNASYDLNSIPITGTNSSAFGYQALLSNTTGSENTANGYQALRNNITGIRVTAVGFQALLNNTASSNTAVGAYSLQANTTGFFNTANGAFALYKDTTGYHNTATGYSALYYNLTGNYNTATGLASLLSNTTGNSNTANGYMALQTNTTGSNNTALGYMADVSSSNLTNATAIGNGASVTTSNAMQLGNSSVTQIFAGTGTTATVITGGLQVTGGTLGVGKVLTSDAAGVATWQTPASGGGSWSLNGNSGTVDGTNFLGTTDNVPFSIRVNNQRSGRIDQTFENVLFGYQAGINFNTTVPNNKATENVAIGHQALYSNQFGFSNTAVGFNALYSNIGSTTSTGGTANVAMGWRSLYYNTLGSDNTALGTQALYNNTGFDNTAVGEIAMIGNTTGDDNTGIGKAALRYNSTGDYNTGLGYDANVSLGNFQNATVIGAQAIGNGSNKVVVGDNTFSIVIGGYANWSNFSDGRFKENVHEDVPGLTFITKLRPVTYTVNIEKLDEHIMQSMPDSTVKARKTQKQKMYAEAATKIQTGFIAQEVEKTAKEIGYNFDGVNIPKNPTDNYSIAYGQFVVPLVKAVQELSKQNEDLKKEMEDLRNLIKGNTEGSIKITESNGAKLFQNAPNPFNKSTTIKYTIPSSSKKAVLTISNSSGVKVKEFDLNGQNIEIAGGQLSAGTYIYSLVVDGATVDSKQMVLTR